MAGLQWFVFDLGNTVIKLAYERVLARLSSFSDSNRDQIMAVLERGGGYRDLERGRVSFREFHEFLGEHAGFRGSLGDLRDIWTDFFDGPIDGIEELLDTVRTHYKVAYASNSNEVHADWIPSRYAVLFRRDERFIFSHLHKCAKPDRIFYDRMLNVLGALPSSVVFVDDLVENVISARDAGIVAYQFHDVLRLTEELTRDGILPGSRV